MKHPIKGVIALVTVAATVILSAAPSAASTGVVMGTLGVNLTPPLSIPIGGLCSSNPATLTPDLTNNPSTGGTITITSTGGAFDYPTSTGSHVLFLVASGTYTVNPTTGDFTASLVTTGTGNGAYITTRTGACTATTTVKCGPMNMSITLTGSWQGASTNDMAGMTTTTVTGSVQAFGCLAPFSAINGKLLSGNLTITI